MRTYDPRRKTFTEHYEFPELPAAPFARYRGFHRYDLTSCIACEACARACPAGCIEIVKERVPDRKGFQVTSFKIDYGKCLFCALCVEPCPVDCIFMGSSHDLSCYSRDGSVVDFSRLPLEIAWGRATLDPLAVAESKAVPRPAHGGPSQ
jgi:NADH-quinone oxidoreductase subunit I